MLLASRGFFLKIPLHISFMILYFPCAIITLFPVFRPLREDLLVPLSIVLWLVYGVIAYFGISTGRIRWYLIFCAILMVNIGGCWRN